MATKQELLDSLDSFTRSYLETALWSADAHRRFAHLCTERGVGCEALHARAFQRATNDESREDGGDPLDANYDVSDFTAKALAEAIGDCKDFQEEYGHLWEDNSNSDAGHNYWLNRSGHGAGFWDGGYKNGDKLDKAAKAAGSVDIYVAGGKLHFS